MKYLQGTRETARYFAYEVKKKRVIKERDEKRRAHDRMVKKERSIPVGTIEIYEKLAAAAVLAEEIGFDMLDRTTDEDSDSAIQLIEMSKALLDCSRAILQH